MFVGPRADRTLRNSSRINRRVRVFGGTGKSLQAAYEEDASKVLAAVEVNVVGALIRCSDSTRKPPHPFPHLLITRRRIHRRRQRAHVWGDRSPTVVSRALLQAHNRAEERGELLWREIPGRASSARAQAVVAGATAAESARSGSACFGRSGPASVVFASVPGSVSCARGRGRSRPAPDPSRMLSFRCSVLASMLLALRGSLRHNNRKSPLSLWIFSAETT